LPFQKELQFGKRQVEININNNNIDAIGIPFKEKLL
jgi:hypothetical protein